MTAERNTEFTIFSERLHRPDSRVARLSDV